MTWSSRAGQASLAAAKVNGGQIAPDLEWNGQPNLVKPWQVLGRYSQSINVCWTGQREEIWAHDPIYDLLCHFHSNHHARLSSPHRIRRLCLPSPAFYPGSLKAVLNSIPRPLFSFVVQSLEYVLPWHWWNQEGFKWPNHKFLHLLCSHGWGPLAK